MRTQPSLEAFEAELRKYNTLEQEIAAIPTLHNIGEGIRCFEAHLIWLHTDTRLCSLGFVGADRARGPVAVPSLLAVLKRTNVPTCLSCSSPHSTRRRRRVAVARHGAAQEQPAQRGGVLEGSVRAEPPPPVLGGPQGLRQVSGPASSQCKVWGFGHALNA